MQHITKFLQENPYIVIITAILGIGGGIIGAVTGWEQFYTVMHSKVSVSGWVILLVFLSFIAVIIIADRNRNSSNTKHKKAVLYEGKTFGIQTVEMDGKSFVRCEFNGTRLVFGAKYPVGLSHCTLNNVSFTFGEHAEMTMQLLSAMYKEMPEIRPMIDATFESVRRGNLPIASPIFKE